jgi:hypothetical protein
MRVKCKGRKLSGRLAGGSYGSIEHGSSVPAVDPIVGWSIIESTGQDISSLNDTGMIEHCKSNRLRMILLAF